MHFMSFPSPFVSQTDDQLVDPSVQNPEEPMLL